MTAIEGLRAYLAASTGVTALCPAARLFPAEGKQDSAAPKVVYERESEVDDYSLTAAGHQPTQHGKLKVYGGRWGDSGGRGGYDRARQLADAIKAADGGFGGGRKLEQWAWDGSSKWGGVGGLIVQAFWFTDDADGRADPADGTGKGEQWVELSFVMCYYKP